MKARSSQRASARVLHQQQQRGNFKASSILALFVTTVLILWFITMYYSKSSMQIGNVQDSSTTFNSIEKASVLVPLSPLLPKQVQAAIEPSKKSTKKKMKVAYAITLTKDGFFQDCAAVLAYSIYNVSKDSNYEVSLLAFVHPNVTEARPLLTKMGFHVIVAPTPIYPPAIKFDFLRTKIEKNGCCGASELIKLNSYRLLEYDWVVHMDADTMLLNPIDELFLENKSLIYTTDPNMATHKGIDKMPVQGGFIVLKPSMDDYSKLIYILMNTEFAQGGGWNRSKIGWFWGGMTVQGVLPYYYNTRAFNPEVRTKVLDRCYYNTMADVPECEKQSLDELKSAHFTVCQKPWNCMKSGFPNDLCRRLHERWFLLRKYAEEFYSIPVNDKACSTWGQKGYVKMNFDNAVFPSWASQFRPDSSVGYMPPIPGSGFPEGVYW